MLLDKKKIGMAFSSDVSKKQFEVVNDTGKSEIPETAFNFMNSCK